MNNLKIGVFGVVLLLMMSSCQSPKDLVFREYNGLALDKMGFTASTLKVNLVYYNPNNFGMDLKRTELDIFLDSTFLGHSSQELQVAIPRRDVFTIPLVVQLDMKNMFKNGMIAYLNKQVAVRCIGTVKVGKGGVYKNIKVDYTSFQEFTLF